MHVQCPWDSRINLVRNRNINVMKRALCLDDYRRVYPTDKRLLFVYSISEAFLFMHPYQITMLNLFALNDTAHLVMPKKEATSIIDTLLKQFTLDDEQEDNVKSLLPFDLDSRQCQQKYKKLQRPKSLDIMEYQNLMKTNFAVLNSKDDQKLLKDCLHI